jgi:hypothetical protein
VSIGQGQGKAEVAAGIAERVEADHGHVLDGTIEAQPVGHSRGAHGQHLSGGRVRPRHQGIERRGHIQALTPAISRA